MAALPLRRRWQMPDSGPPPVVRSPRLGLGNRHYIPEQIDIRTLDKLRWFNAKQCHESVCDLNTGLRRLVIGKNHFKLKKVPKALHLWGERHQIAVT